MANECICATALYYYDCENVTDSSLTFRTQTDCYQDPLQGSGREDGFRWIEHIYGTGFASKHEVPALQYYGRVKTHEGRLLAFPNIFQHQASSFSLKDRTKPGHRRFIALCCAIFADRIGRPRLVSPYERIISTGNVPPQQLDWWADAVFGFDSSANHGGLRPEVFHLLTEKLGPQVQWDKCVSSEVANTLPSEIMEMVRQYGGIGGDGLMDLHEAKEHRIRLMDERSKAEGQTRGVLRQSYPPSRSVTPSAVRGQCWLMVN
ncbi:hypothetical protein PG994_006798 [Apiospora phragmitis]|uniref:DUF4246 domain-containing protein n=1 Tax=Apiospora phragmitis TaxID=2905665 RepID=A0ABR1VGB2_9PEZI